MMGSACDTLAARGRVDCWRPSIGCRDTRRADIGDIVGPVVNRGQRISVSFGCRSAKHLQRSAILPLPEVQRPRAFDLFQP